MQMRLTGDGLFFNNINSLLENAVYCSQEGISLRAIGDVEKYKAAVAVSNTIGVTVSYSSFNSSIIGIDTCVSYVLAQTNPKQNQATGGRLFLASQSRKRNLSVAYLHSFADV